jgi:hypothetical protein
LRSRASHHSKFSRRFSENSPSICYGGLAGGCGARR